MALGGVNPYKLHTFANRNISTEQGNLAHGILGNSSTSPQSSIDRIGRNAAAIGLAYNIESYQIQQAQSNKQANKNTHNLALPARGIATA
ncbi:MAG: hypothetical protein HYZ79_05670 [Candidatus Melainabacteria bacterium]|nr:hypothetical protein [Candidatus Melainabacteria bacterium]